MRITVHLLTLSLLAISLVLSGCDFGGSGNGLPIEGSWVEVSDQETPLYLEITSETYTEYETYTPGGCYQRQGWDIIERDGNTYTLRDQDDSEIWTATIVVEGNELNLQGLDFEKTDVDPSSLRCE